MTVLTSGLTNTTHLEVWCARSRNLLATPTAVEDCVDWIEWTDDANREAAANGEAEAFWTAWVDDGATSGEEHE